MVEVDYKWAVISAAVWTPRREGAGIETTLRARLLPALRRTLMLATILTGFVLAFVVLAAPARASVFLASDSSSTSEKSDGSSDSKDSGSSDS